jgi:Aerotolerance regulator N-terminal
MEFLNPSALYALAVAPLLLLPYLIRSQPRRTVFSSLVIVRELVARPRGRGWRWLRVPPIFFLQLLLLSLLLFTLGEPVVAVRPRKIAVVLDNSASMQAAEDGKSRFSIAQEETRKLLSDLPVGGRVDLFVTAPRLAQIGEGSMGAGKALAVMGTLRPYDLPDAGGDLGRTLSDLMKRGSYDRVFFLTDHPVQHQGEVIKVISIGAPKDNLTLTAFQVSPVSLTSQKLRASAEVMSFSSREEKFKISVNSAGKTLSNRDVTIAAGGTVEIFFDDLAPLPLYEAELKVSDGLALDNRQFAVSSSSKGWEVLAVSPRPEVVQSLRSIPGLSVKVIAPEDYGKYREARHALELFHYSMPDILPARHALFILPPSENALVRVGPAIQRPVISSWREPHPLTDYVNFALFRPSYARALTARVVAEPILDGPGGTLALTMEHEGFRYAVLGFDPLPYLGRENLPMSIFTLNLFKWFSGALGAGAILAGQPIEFSPLKEGGLVLTPSGERIALKPGTHEFTPTFFQGLYQIAGGDEKQSVAVNFTNVAESDLLHPVAVRLPDEAKNVDGKPASISLWMVLILVAVALLVLERFLNPPALQPQAARSR